MKLVKLILLACLLLSNLEIISMNTINYYDQFPKLEDIKNNKILRTNLINLGDHEKDPKGKSGLVNILLGYNEDHLYLYLESIQDDVQFLDRGYQNGDGLHLTIANPNNPENNASEFYVLGFAIQEKDKVNWQNKFVWYQDTDLAMYRLRDTEFNWFHDDGLLSLEIIMPWSLLHPYHPWFDDFLLGFNICYVKADRGEGKEYYFLHYDEKMQSEQSVRKFVKFLCSEPKAEKFKFYAQLDRYNLIENNELYLKIASSAEDSLRENLIWRLYSGENTYIKGDLLELNITKGFSIKKISINLIGLRSDGYRLNFNMKNDSRDLHFTILPDVELNKLSDGIENLNITQSSKYTLQLMLNNLIMKSKNHKWYNTAYSLRSELAELNNLISQSEKIDIIKQKRGMMRRGFLSQIDNTIQPYSLFFPETWGE